MNGKSLVGDEIIVLSGAEAIRHRPEMYVGDIRASDLLTRLISEMLCLPAKLASPETPVHATITLIGGERVSVEDDSPGLCDHPMHDGRTRLEHMMTELYACREQGMGHPSFDICRMGIVVVNALSRLMRLEVKRANEATRVLVFSEGLMRYSISLPVSSGIDVGTRSPTGNRLTFYPDPNILPDVRFDPGQLEELALRASATVPGLIVTFEEVSLAGR